jgi:enoyl-CoA hydratase/carnithine racemase
VKRAFGLLDASLLQPYLAETVEGIHHLPGLIAEVSFSQPDSEEFLSGGPKRLYEQAVRLFACQKPIVAAIQGAAIGGGLGLALVADFRVVSPEARFAANFVKLGIHPGFGLTYTLPA